MSKFHGPTVSRRAFTGLLVAGSAWLQSPKADAQPPAQPAAPSAANQTVSLAPLPYAENALEPFISANTLATHHGQHHRSYVEKTQALVKGTPLDGKDLEAIVRGSATRKSHERLFQSAAQTYNHHVYWQSMRPSGGGAPTGELSARIERDFGSYAAFREKFVQTALDHFSNGWVWLVLEKNRLRIVDTHDAGTPLTTPGQKPLLTMDVWEHAYYLDAKNRRKEYVHKFVDSLLNWDFVARQLA